MNYALIWVLTIAMTAITAVLCYLLISQKRQPNTQDVFPQLMSDFQRELGTLKESVYGQVRDLSKQMNDYQTENTRFLQKTHQGYSEAVGAVQHRLGQLQEATQSMIHIGKDISSLQDILRAPKLRGGLGEMILGELLRQILPEDNYCLQYSFPDGSKVDAVVILGEAMIPVDAKFPLENFKRIIAAKEAEDEKAARKQFIVDVKKHIDSIASKYILPTYGTFDFALMYIPAENVYYETIIKEDTQNESLSDYAVRKKVIPVSPNSFYAYLQAIVRGLKGLRIEQSAQRILESLGQLEADFEKFYVDFEKMGGHLSNAQSAYERAFRSFDKLHHRLTSIDAGQSKVLLPDSPPKMD